MSASLISMIAWYKSWFSTGGTLDFEGYLKHLFAAHAIFAGFLFVGFCLFFLVFFPLMALHGPPWTFVAAVMIVFPIWVLGLFSWTGILIASTLRFARHLMMQHWGRDASH